MSDLDHCVTHSTPALLVTHTRSGGTMLNYALSTHPQIFWVRDEPMLPQNEWKTAFPDATDTQILDCITGMHFYKVAGCKVTYHQLSQEVVEWIRDRKPRVIHLWRENLLRAAVSKILTGMKGEIGHVAHSFHRIEQVKIGIAPDVILDRAALLLAGVEMRKSLLDRTGADVHGVSYEELTNGESEVSEIYPATASGICDFLGVARLPLHCDLKRVNYAPLSQILTNWKEVKEGLAGTMLKRYLDEEE